jgi:PAS domain S-box-containing protein
MPSQFTKKPDDQQDDLANIREQIIGLGEKSIRKSYYPELLKKLADLERYKTLIDQSNDAIFLIDVHSGLLISASKSACKQIGYPEEKCLTMAMYDLLPDNREELQQYISGKAESQVLDTKLRKGSGEETPYEVNMHRARFGGKDYVVAVARDITERKKAEEALRRQASLIDLSPDGIIVRRRDGTISFWSKGAESLYGWTRDEAIGQKTHILFKTRLPLPLGEINKILQQTGHWSGELIHTTKDGRQVTVQSGWLTRTEEHGNGCEILESNVDITERKRAEEKLRDSEEKFRALAESSTAAIIVYQGDWLVSVNPAAETISGYSNDELLKMKLIDVIHPDFKGLVQNRAHRRLRGEPVPSEYEIKIVTKGGEVKWVLISVGRIEYRGKPAGVATLFDITKRKRAEEALGFTQFAIDRAQDQAFWITEDGHFFYVNDAACRALRYSREELLKMSVPDIDPTFPTEVFARSWQNVREHGSSKFETIHRAKDGRVYPVEIRANYVVFNGKEYNCAFATDITERKRAEEALKDAKAQAELYLDLMGHDITNMNQALMGYLEMMDLMRESGEVDKGLIDSSIEIINRSSRMINDVKKLTRVQAGKISLRSVDVCEILSAVKSEYSNVPGRAVRINYCPGRDCMVMACDLLKDVFENLVDNAIKHSTGPLTIDLSVDTIKIERHAYYKITVSDTGPGIPDELKKKIFMPLKEAVEMTARRGFGLYLVKSLVDGFGGLVIVEDRVPGDHSKGARFVVMLPAIDQ